MDLALGPACIALQLSREVECGVRARVCTRTHTHTWNSGGRDGGAGTRGDPCREPLFVYSYEREHWLSEASPGSCCVSSLCKARTQSR